MWVMVRLCKSELCMTGVTSHPAEQAVPLKLIFPPRFFHKQVAPMEPEIRLG